MASFPVTDTLIAPKQSCARRVVKPSTHLRDFVTVAFPLRIRFSDFLNLVNYVYEDITLWSYPFVINI